MNIEVTTEDRVYTYIDCTKWVIDDDGRLHIVGSSGNFASYNNGTWLYVHKAAKQ